MDITKEGGGGGGGGGGMCVAVSYCECADTMWGQRMMNDDIIIRS